MVFPVPCHGSILLISDINANSLGGRHFIRDMRVLALLAASDRSGARQALLKLAGVMTRRYPMHEIFPTVKS